MLKRRRFCQVKEEILKKLSECGGAEDARPCTRGLVGACKPRAYQASRARACCCVWLHVGLHIGVRFMAVFLRSTVQRWCFVYLRGARREVGFRVHRQL